MQLRTRWLPIFFFALAGCGDETDLPKEPQLFTDRDEVAFNREFGSGTFVNASNVIGHGFFIGGTLRNNGLLRASGGTLGLSASGVSGGGTAGFNAGTMAVASGATMTLNSGNWSNST